MSEDSGIIKISSSAAGTSVVNNTEPFVVFNDKLPMLSEVMPEFKFGQGINAQELSDRLKLTMKQYGGIGLAANQCGLPYRVFVLADHDKSYAYFNPRIVHSAPNELNDVEGCLSFPGMMLKIPRSAVIDVEYENENGVSMKAELKGVAARVFQHELDHLNGIKFIEKVGKTSLHMAKKKQKKILKRFGLK